MLIFIKQGTQPRKSTRPPLQGAGAKAPPRSSQSQGHGSTAGTHQGHRWGPFRTTPVWSRRWGMDAKDTTLPPTGSHRSLWRSLHIQTWAQRLGSTCEASEVCSVRHTPFTMSMSSGQITPSANTSHTQFQQPQHLHPGSLCPQLPRHPPGPL